MSNCLIGHPLVIVIEKTMQTVDGLITRLKILENSIPGL